MWSDNQKQIREMKTENSPLYFVASRPLASWPLKAFVLWIPEAFVQQMSWILTSGHSCPWWKDLAPAKLHLPLLLLPLVVSRLPLTCWLLTCLLVTGLNFPSDPFPLLCVPPFSIHQCLLTLGLLGLIFTTWLFLFLSTPSTYSFHWNNLSC